MTASRLRKDSGMDQSRGIVALCGVGAVALLFVAGCGGGDETASQQELNQAYKEGQQAAQDQAAQQRTNRQLKNVKEKLQDIKNGDGSETTTSTGSTSGSTGATTSCGSGIGAGANTSCAFAQNVANAYYDSGGQTTLDVYSPTTGQTYTMTCTPGSPTICRGGNNASVYVP